MAATPSNHSPSKTAPVGLLGLQIMIMRVRSLTRDSSRSRSARQQPASQSGLNSQGTSLAPSPRTRPGSWP